MEKEANAERPTPNAQRRIQKGHHARADAHARARAHDHDHDHDRRLVDS